MRKRYKYEKYTYPKEFEKKTSFQCMWEEFIQKYKKICIPTDFVPVTRLDMPTGQVFYFDTVTNVSTNLTNN